MSELIYCHNRKCVRDDCIRKEIYMPFNVLCRRRTFDCSETNGFKYFLGEDSDEGIKTYTDILSDAVNYEGIKFYIEPFVGNTKTLNIIQGNFIRYGTDVDGDKIRVLIKKYPDLSKNLRAGDYKTWSKILLDDKYAGHCVVYCEPPMRDTFNQDDFVSISRKWAEMNSIFVRCREDLLFDSKWEKISKIDNIYSMYKVT